jgi:hypothetical protein
MSERARERSEQSNTLFAKSDDDVGSLRAMREQRAQTKLWGTDNRTSEDSCRPHTPFRARSGNST